MSAQLGENCIQNFHLGRYIVGYAVGNLVSDRIRALQAARHPTKCDVINDVKLFPALYRRIYYRKFLTLSNQTQKQVHYKSKCIRIKN